MHLSTPCWADALELLWTHAAEVLGERTFSISWRSLGSISHSGCRASSLSSQILTKLHASTRSASAWWQCTAAHMHPTLTSWFVACPGHALAGSVARGTPRTAVDSRTTRCSKCHTSGGAPCQRGSVELDQPILAVLEDLAAVVHEQLRHLAVVPPHRVLRGAESASSGTASISGTACRGDRARMPYNCRASEL